MIKIVSIALNVFILKTVDKPWTSRAVPDVLVKFSLVSEEHVTVVSYTGKFLFFWYFSLPPQNVHKSRFRIIREGVIIIVLEALAHLIKRKHKKHKKLTHIYIFIFLDPLS